MANLQQLLHGKETAENTKVNGVTLGIFSSPVNGHKIELIANFRSNKKLGNDFIQLSILALDGDYSDNSASRSAICGTCPFKLNGACYAKDQGLTKIKSEYLKGKYKPMDLDVFLAISKNYNIRFGRFGDLSLIPFEVVDSIAQNCKGFTGYTNQWRSSYYDPRFNSIFMLSTVGEKDSKAAFKKYPNARQFKVIKSTENYIDDIKTGFITCPSQKGFLCSDCLLCDGQTAKKATYNIEVKVHGLSYKINRTNKLLKNDKKDL